MLTYTHEAKDTLPCISLVSLLIRRACPYSLPFHWVVVEHGPGGDNDLDQGKQHSADVIVEYKHQLTSASNTVAPPKMPNVTESD